MSGEEMLAAGRAIAAHIDAGVPLGFTWVTILYGPGPDGSVDVMALSNETNRASVIAAIEEWVREAKKEEGMRG